VVNSRDRERFHLVEGHHADLGVFQCHGVAGMAVVDDAVQADDLARHLEAGHLVAAIGGGDAGLEEARAHGVQRGECFAGGKQRTAALDAPPRGDEAVKLVHFLVVEAHGQAQFTQVATRAGDLDVMDVHKL
jgi:hypothetical protein